jgi:hypothetical protein
MATSEFKVRDADVIEKSVRNARSTLDVGDPAIAAVLLNEPIESIERVSGSPETRGT